MQGFLGLIFENKNKNENKDKKRITFIRNLVLMGHITIQLIFLSKDNKMLLVLLSKNVENKTMRYLLQVTLLIFMANMDIGARVFGSYF